VATTTQKDPLQELQPVNPKTLPEEDSDGVIAPENDYKQQMPGLDTSDTPEAAQHTNTEPESSQNRSSQGENTTSESAPGTEKKRWNVKIRSWHATTGNDIGPVGVEIMLVYLYNIAFPGRTSENADFLLFEEEENDEADTQPHGDSGSPGTFLKELLDDTFVARMHSDPSKPAPAKTAKRERLPLSETKTGVTVVNWLKNPEMLPKYFPDARITTIAFDVHGRSDSPMDITGAGEQLREYLSTIDRNQPSIPIVFIGHTWGAAFVFQALLGYLKRPEPRLDIFQRTAGGSSFLLPY
jgi:hypothetical protein